MYMNDEEQKTYNKLDFYEKNCFDLAEHEYPDESFSARLLRAVRAAESLKEGLKGAPIKDPRTQHGILVRAAKKIEEIAPKIWEQVKDNFKSAISYLGDMIKNGLKWMDTKWNEFCDWLDDIFS